MQRLLFVLAAVFAVIVPVAAGPSVADTAPVCTATGWRLIETFGVKPTDWIDPATKNTADGKNLSAMISPTPRSRKELAELIGDGDAIYASTVTWGVMTFGHINGVKQDPPAQVAGYVVVTEGLAVYPAQPVYWEKWQRGADNRWLKWYRVARAMRCGNTFRAVALRDIRMAVAPVYVTSPPERTTVTVTRTITRCIPTQTSQCATSPTWGVSGLFPIDRQPGKETEVSTFDVPVAFGAAWVFPAARAFCPSTPGQPVVPGCSPNAPLGDINPGTGQLYTPPVPTIH